MCGNIRTRGCDPGALNACCVLVYFLSNVAPDTTQRPCHAKKSALGWGPKNENTAAAVFCPGVFRLMLVGHVAGIFSKRVRQLVMH